MNESEINALLEAHDGLIRACLDGALGVADFVAAYGGFPRSYGLDGPGAAAEDLAVLRRFRPRIAFHSHMAGVLAGFGSIDAEEAGMPGDFMTTVVLQRLRMLVAKHPEFRV